MSDAGPACPTAGLGAHPGGWGQSLEFHSSLLFLDSSLALHYPPPPPPGPAPPGSPFPVTKT